MNRRNFVLSSASLLGVGFPLLSKAQSLPCPPPTLSVEGGATVSTGCEDSVLHGAARSLGRGQSVTIDDPGLSSSALHTIQWANRFHVDVAAGRAHLIGKNASSQGRQRSNCVYDIRSNKWTYAIYGGTELGHVYESFAYDPERYEVYTGRWNGNVLKSWRYGDSLDEWKDPATASLGRVINSDTQPAICWFPHLFGQDDGGILALTHESATKASVVAWHRRTNQWHSLAATVTTGMSGSYISNGAVEYVAGGRFCIASFPPSQGGRTFRIDAGSNGALGNVSEIKNVPIHCGYVATPNERGRGILIDDPTGAASAYILEKGGHGRVWKYVDGSWSLRSYRHPFNRSSIDWVVATCRSLGVFWAKYNRPDVSSLLWKPND